MHGVAVACAQRHGGGGGWQASMHAGGGRCYQAPRHDAKPCAHAMLGSVGGPTLGVTVPACGLTRNVDHAWRASMSPRPVFRLGFCSFPSRAFQWSASRPIRLMGTPICPPINPNTCKSLRHGPKMCLLALNGNGIFASRDFHRSNSRVKQCTFTCALLLHKPQLYRFMRRLRKMYYT